MEALLCYSYDPLIAKFQTAHVWVPNVLKMSTSRNIYWLSFALILAVKAAVVLSTADEPDEGAYFARHSDDQHRTD